VLDRALAFTWAVAETIADEVVRVPRGTVLRTPSLRGAWSVNGLRLEGAQPDLTLAGAAAECAEQLPDLPYVHLIVEDEPTADRLAADARAEGWRVDRTLYMALRGAPERDVDTSRVREGDLEEVLDLTDEWFVEEGEATSPEVAADLREMTRREHAATPERRFVVDDPPGRLAAMTSMRERDRVCQLEDVYVRPDVRGRGHARALVTHAAAFARRDDHEVVFIVADEDDWPRRLYASVGFAPLGRTAILHRDR
jgi:predicted GNAT family acetyltransferase